MRYVELFLRMLAEQVDDALLGGRPLETPDDFKRWLYQCSIVAYHSPNLNAFFNAIKK